MRPNYKQLFYAVIFIVAASFVHGKYEVQINKAVELGRSQCKNERVIKSKKRAAYQVYNYKEQLRKDMNKSTPKLVLDRTIRWINNF